MPKIDKTQFTKEEWHIIREQRRSEKQQKVEQEITQNLQQRSSPVVKNKITDTSFVLGNGTSRESINPEDLEKHGKIYGCNALYRTFSPDYLIAVDVKMVLEISKSGYSKNNQVWTNPNRSYKEIKDLNFFHPSKGWSSGPTALWLASQHNPTRIFILGFDYKGLDEGKRLNNIYADTINYKKSTDSATYYGNWLRQTGNVIKENPRIQYFRVIKKGNYCPPELEKFKNFRTITIEDFQKMFNIF